MAIWVTLAAVWKIIWHLYSRLIGIFYETRACRKRKRRQKQQQQQDWETFVLLGSRIVLVSPLCSAQLPALTLALKIAGKINLMSKTCNKLQRHKARAISKSISFVSPVIYFLQIYFDNLYIKLGHHLVGLFFLCVFFYGRIEIANKFNFIKIFLFRIASYLFAATDVEKRVNFCVFAKLWNRFFICDLTFCLLSLFLPFGLLFLIFLIIYLFLCWKFCIFFAVCLIYDMCVLFQCASYVQQYVRLKVSILSWIRQEQSTALKCKFSRH